MKNDLTTLADVHGTRYASPDEQGVSFELSALDAFVDELIEQKDAEIAALRSAVQAVIDCDDDYRYRSLEDERMDYDKVVKQCREAIAQAVQP